MSARNGGAVATKNKRQSKATRAPEPEPSPPFTVASYVLNEIRAGILTGKFPLGSRLNQEGLAELLGVSIIPVRESLRRLEAEGLVTITARRGANVVDLDPAKIAEIYKIREPLEVLAARSAVPHLEAEQLDELHRLNEAMGALGDEHSIDWANLNREWHFSLYDAARAPLLAEMIGQLWDRCTLYRQVYTRDTKHRAVSLADHARILEACRAHDPQAAGDEMARHVVRSADDAAAHV